MAADPLARPALETLCRQYWYPLYSFIRRQGRTHHEAEDCTQEFLAQLLASHGIAHAKPERGRFRTYLLAALRNYLTNEWHRARTAKRGGDQAPLSLEFDLAEKRFSREPAEPALTPEHCFDREWAIGLIDQATAELRDEYRESGRSALFAALEPLVWQNSSPVSHAELAQRLNLTTHAFTVALQRLRRRLGERLRLAVAQTVAGEAEVDAELRYLISAMTANPQGPSASPFSSNPPKRSAGQQCATPLQRGPKPTLQ
jgi:RNA polymerase sigma-70 factor (ECF subfamily)